MTQFATFLRYWSLISRYIEYLKFLPLLASLVQFVRAAQRDFRTNEDRAAWAAEQFRNLVQIFASSGLLNADQTRRLLKGTDAFVTAIVSWFNVTQGDVPPAPPLPGKPFPYSEVLNAYPDVTLLVPGDEIYEEPNGAARWIVWGQIGPKPDAWRLVKTL